MYRPKRNGAVEANNILFGLNEISSSDDSGDEEDDEKDAIISDDNDEEQESDHENQTLDQNMISKNGDEIWSAFPVIGAAQPHAHNIIRQPTGPTRLAAQTCGMSVNATFKLFITQEMNGIVVNWNNVEARRIRLERWVDTTVNEIYVYIGLLPLVGVFHSKNQSIKELWSTTDGIRIFSASIQRDRFIDLRRCVQRFATMCSI